MAVGYNEDSQTLIEQWNGTQWRLDSHSNGALQGVSCTSVRFCMAVGSSGALTLVEQWNGSTWHMARSPNPRSNSDALDAVSCTSPSFCAAVGSFSAGSRTLVEQWNGTRWARSPSPNVGPAQTGLMGVSCVGTQFCEAVGIANEGWPLPQFIHTFVVAFNGSTWTHVPSPNGTTVRNAGNYLNAVSCSSRQFCIAVGGYALFSPGSAPERVLVEKFTGSWSRVSISGSSLPDAWLTAVSCVDTRLCAAVGESVLPYTTSYRTLAERLSATWRQDVSENTANPRSWLNAVSCTSGGFCAAVGADGGASGNNARTLTERGP
jgi:hypothetical protein